MRYKMMEVKDAKVLPPVAEPRAEASQMWLPNYPSDALGVWFPRKIP
jgi:hypothetical protein